MAVMPAEYAAFQLGDGPWYGYWYGVIRQVVEGPYAADQPVKCVVVAPSIGIERADGAARRFPAVATSESEGWRSASKAQIGTG